MQKIAVFVLLMSLALGGCSLPTVPHVESPSARVLGATLTEQTAEGASVAVEVELANPNDFALPVTFETYRVELDGRVYNFRGKSQASMPPMGTQKMTLTGAVATGGGDVAGTAYKASGHFVYIKPGEIRRILVDFGWPEAKVYFNESGTLD